MAMTALELGLRGAVVALFLVVCAVLLLRYAAVNRAASLGAAMGAMMREVAEALTARLDPPSRSIAWRGDTRTPTAVVSAWCSTARSW